ncbi:MAG: cupredoxin domain-containing protein [Actinomycetota bacterium]
MKWLSRSIIPSMVAFAAVVSFLPRTGPTVELKARDFSFSKQTLHVRAGETILVSNVGRFTHTFTCPDCGVDSGNVEPGQSITVKFGRTGTFSFFCVYHADQGMTGQVVVSR